MPVIRRRKQQPRRRRGPTPSKQFSQTLGLVTLAPRERFKVITVFNDVLNNASLVLPYAFAYVDLSTPLKANGGAATVVPYWSILTALCRKFFVEKTSVVVEFVNQETFGVDAFICPINFLPAQSIVQGRACLSNVRAKKRLISGVGSPNRCTLKSTQSVRNFGGFTPRTVEDPHWGNTDGSSDPTDKLYLEIGADTNGSASVAGILVSVKLIIYGWIAEPNTPLL